MKTVLFLVNGFGIEKKESFSVYDASIMPNFDKLMKKYMFGKLSSNVKNTLDGYRNMSLEINSLYNYGVYKKESISGNLIKNNTYLDLQKELNGRKSKLHLFCFVDTSLNIVDNLKDFLKNINKERDKTIYLHLILTSNNYEDYPSIVDVLSKINMELSEEAKIGMIMGLANILNSNPLVDLNFLLRNMISELGEKWQSFKQKLDVSYGTKESPMQVKPFVVNSGFSIGNNDLFLIWNYDNVDLTNFINGVKSIDYKEIENTIKFYSLFPITTKDIPFILNYEVSKVSLASNMKGLGFKTIVMAQKDDINGINYYLNGMEMVNNKDITYIAMEDVLYNKEAIVNIINTYQEEFIILNYNVESVSSVENLQEQLKNIDSVLGAIYDNTEKNSYNIVISSLYGINKTLKNSSGEVCNIIYSNVPIIYANNFVTKKDYIISEGNISDLFRVCYQSINKKYPGETIINKKNILYRMIFK